MSNGPDKNQEILSEECLKGIFNHFAQKVVKDFPHLRDKFIFYSSVTDSFHGALARGYAANAVTDALQEEADALFTDGIPETAFAGFDRGYYTMAFVDQQADRSMTSMRENREQEILNILEHELGHLVVPSADYDCQDGHNRNFCESAADAFSMIRHFQANGAFGGALDTTAWVRTLDFITSTQKLPLTAPVLTELKDLAMHHDIAKLTPTETANLAYRLALHNSYSDGELKDLRDTFKPVQKLLRDGNLKSALRKCGEILLAAKDDASGNVLATGRALLEPFLSSRKYILNTQFEAKDIENLSLTGAFWDKVRAKIRLKRPRVSKELDRLQTLGVFDSSVDKIIDPANYESIKNQITLAAARETHAAKAPRKQAGKKPSR